MRADYKRWIRFRIYLVLGFFLLSFLAIFARAFDLQVLKAEYLQKLAENEYTRTVHLAANRGLICDRNGEILAISSKAYSIFANPAEIGNPGEVSRRLSAILRVNRKNLLKNLKKKRCFVWIKRQVTPEEAKRVNKLDIKGIYFLRENRRYYPDRYLACHILGFAGVDTQGLEGLELAYDSYLKRDTGYFNALRDALGRIIFVYADFSAGEKCYDLTLTIDKRIQHITEVSLERAVQRTEAKDAMAIVMNPKTGEILAMVNYPPFDPNTFLEYSPSRWRNRTITDTFEPGSVFKVFVLAEALEDGVTKAHDIFFCENGIYSIDRDTVIHDVHKRGWLSVENIIKFSSNIGIAKISEGLESQRLYDYLEAFGFGEKTEIDLPGEVRGLVNPPSKWSKLDKYAICFGQGIATTALQLCSALSAIANDGVLVRPFLVKKIVDKGGRIVKHFAPRVVRRVVSSKTAQDVTSILSKVVQEDGTGKMAFIEGYQVAGKTGTAQKAEPGGKGYAEDKYISSFMGFVPAEDPQLAALVVINEPKGVKYGGAVAAPVFREMIQKMLVCLNIPPKKTIFASNLGKTRKCAQTSSKGRKI